MIFTILVTSWLRNLVINSVNPLYLIIHSVTEYFKEKKDEKYLIIDSTDKYEEVLSGIRLEIKTIYGGKELLDKNLMLKVELILRMIYLWKNH